MCSVSTKAYKPILKVTKNKNDEPEKEHNMSPQMSQTRQERILDPAVSHGSGHIQVSLFP